MSVPVIAVDAMGGDFGPHSVVPASVSSLAEFPSLHLVLVGHSRLIEELLALYPEADRSRLEIVHADEVIGMDERPSQALRGKPNASMRVALELLSQGRVGACVSAGNTGALMALSRALLNTLPGIDRPAIVSAIPTASGDCQVLDLGANVDCSAEHLHQFAVMGAAAAEVLGVSNARVALLNVGTESEKGNRLVKAAATLLEGDDALNYIGFIEGDALFRGEADVVVCDGFVGNVMLKCSEGLVKLITGRIEALFNESISSRLVGSVALPVLRRLREDLAPARHNGASFLGLQHIVIKSHGGAGTEGFQSAIRRAMDEIGHDLPRRLEQRLGQRLRAHVTDSDGDPSN